MIALDTVVGVLLGVVERALLRVAADRFSHPVEYGRKQSFVWRRSFGGSIAASLELRPRHIQVIRC
jgi:hypothetical protein